MSEQSPTTYTIQDLSSLAQYQRYELSLQAPECVVLVAKPLENIRDYKFGKKEDAYFDLSAVVGVQGTTLIWGGTGYETTTRRRVVKNRHSGDRELIVNIPGEGGTGTEAKLNLDQYLDIIEYEDAGEIRRKLGKKTVMSTKRSIVLCFDGTSNHFSNLNTNVVKLVELLKKNNPARQMVYYQTGVGTYAPPGFLTRIGLKVAAKVDEGIAWYFQQHVMDGYKYLMQNYHAGDEISIFGFSRGAYTARALAGMIHSVGLLPKYNIENVPFAYQIYEASTEAPRPHGEYRQQDPNKSSLPENVDPAEFKRTFSIPVMIHFLGVWDTVGSIGAFRRKNLPWIEYNPSVLYFRQALALDENRVNFIPSVWDHSRTNQDYQNAREVWFKGGHSDVGGGARFPSSEREKGEGLLSKPLLSNISLRWMVRQCLDHTSVVFDGDVMYRYRRIGILEDRPADRNSEEGKKEYQRLKSQLDEVDVLEEPFVALEDNWWWKVLEYAPVPKQQQLVRSGQAGTEWSPNAGASRLVYLGSQASHRIYLHGSVVGFLKSDKKTDLPDPKKSTKPYAPSVEWHGYDEDDTWPDIEDPPPGFKEVLGKGPGADKVLNALKMKRNV